MKRLSIALRQQARRSETQHSVQARPSSPDSIDFAIQALGGTTEAIQLWRLPSKTVAASPQQRIAELEEERNCLRRDIDAEGQKCRRLLEIVPALRSQIGQLQQMVELYNVEIQEACIGWEASKRGT
ncbi:hypothetical protein NLG97_g8852 [Lecanicillium saksenae]|uniref:Uncharacterized protein n=1 Tax=Lecanicillium saksenae TaxID=468837 RepID=A0ACC1QKD0_9HYPO|nr:hypothetical protein NLG97_g8852 [Lecanicillium saksenae]